MCRLFETIRIENGQPLHLRWHEERMRKPGLMIRDPRAGNLEPGIGLRLLDSGLWLKSIIKVPENMQTGIVKCNVIYGQEILEISFRPNIKRPVRSLKLVYTESFDYHLKYSDRTGLEELFARRGLCDDIIIVNGGLITDSSISNLVFYDGSMWYTPAHPLLEGTCRARLIAQGKIIPLDIRPEDLHHYRGCKLINAMREPQEEEIVGMSNIE